jgi:hypothetical protein
MRTSNFATQIVFKKVTLWSLRQTKEQYRKRYIVRSFITCTVIKWRRMGWGGRRRWWGNAEMDVKGTGYEGRDWINLAQGRNRLLPLVNTIMKLRVS